MRAGSHKATTGKLTRITRRITSVSTKGDTPRKMVEKLVSGSTLLITNTFMPTGGVIIVMAVTLGMIMPPVGINVFVINSIARDISLPRIYVGVAPFIASDLARLAILVALPSLSLALPEAMDRPIWQTLRTMFGV